MFSQRNGKAFEAAIDELDRWLGDSETDQPDQAPIYSTYRNYFLGLLVDDKDPWYFGFVKAGSYFDLFCAAEIRIEQCQQGKSEDCKTKIEETKALYLKAANIMPIAFDILGEVLMKNLNMADALTVYKKGIAKINQFLAGKTEIFGFKVGENSQQYRDNDPQTADEVDLDEISICEEMLRLFEAKYYLCEMVVMEQNAPPPVKKSSKKKKKKKSRTPEQQTTGQPTSDKVPESELLTPPVQPPAPPKTTPTKTMGAESVGKAVPASGEPVSVEPSTRDQSTLLKADRKIRLDADYDEAYRLLNCCSASKNSPLWFKRKQHMAWLFLQESQDDQYLQKSYKGQELIKARSDLLKKARREVRDGLNKLIRICRPDNQTDVLAIPVDTVMKMALELEEQHIGFRVELGSLYSTMGHILKTERDRLNPRTQREQCVELVQQANRFFQLSHRVLGKRLS